MGNARAVGRILWKRPGEGGGGAAATIEALLGTEVGGRHDQPGTAGNATLSDGPEPHAPGGGGGRVGVPALPPQVSGARGHPVHARGRGRAAARRRLAGRPALPEGAQPRTAVKATAPPRPARSERPPPCP